MLLSLSAARRGQWLAGDSSPLRRALGFLVIFLQDTAGNRTPGEEELQLPDFFSSQHPITNIAPTTVNNHGTDIVSRTHA